MLNARYADSWLPEEAAAADSAATRSRLALSGAVGSSRSLEGPCHIVERCARIWHELDSGFRRESRGVREGSAELTGEIRWK